MFRAAGEGAVKYNVSRAAILKGGGEADPGFAGAGSVRGARQPAAQVLHFSEEKLQVVEGMGKVKGESAAAFLRAGFPALRLVFDVVAEKAPVHLAMERRANRALFEEFPGATPFRNFGKKEIHHVGYFFGAGLFEQRFGLCEVHGKGFFGKDGNAALQGEGDDLVLVAGDDGDSDGVGPALLEHGAPVAEKGDGGLPAIIEQAVAAFAKDADGGAVGDLLEGGQDTYKPKPDPATATRVFMRPRPC